MKTKLFIVNGQGGVGKDTFVELVISFLYLNKIYKTSNISTVDEVKHAAFELGWDGVKTPEARLFLSELKNLSTKFNDGPYNYVKSFLERNDDFVFVHSREPGEIQRFVDDFGAKTILVTRGEKVDLGNKSDNDVFNFKYDYVIENYGSLDDLYDTAEGFVKAIL